MSDVVILIPVLARPHRIDPLLASIENGRGDRPLDYLFIASPHDSQEIATLRRRSANFIVSTWPAGHADWSRKCNLGYRETTAPFVLLAADDVCFCPGWADAAMMCAEETGAGVIGTNDLSSPRVVAGEHSCHPLVRRSYVEEHGTIDEPGKMLCDQYDHNFPDDELIGTARARGEWMFCASSHVEHLHPSWSKGVDDETYRKGQLRFYEDRRLFERRRQLWL